MIFNAPKANSLPGLLLLAICSSSHGAENEESSVQPDLEFLEFLGQFETDEGEWIEPSSLMSDEFESLLNAADGISNSQDDENNASIDSNLDNDN